MCVFREKRLEEEKQLVNEQKKRLQDELESLTKEVIALRQEKTSKISELHSDLARKIEEVLCSFILILIFLSDINFNFIIKICLVTTCTKSNI